MAAVTLSVLAVRQSDSWPIWENAMVRAEALATMLSTRHRARTRTNSFFMG